MESHTSEETMVWLWPEKLLYVHGKGSKFFWFYFPQKRYALSFMWKHWRKDKTLAVWRDREVTIWRAGPIFFSKVEDVQHD